MTGVVSPVLGELEEFAVVFAAVVVVVAVEVVVVVVDVVEAAFTLTAISFVKPLELVTVIVALPAPTAFTD